MAALEGGLLKMLGLQPRGWRAWRELALLASLFLDLSWIAPWLHALLAASTTVSAWTVAGVLALQALASYAIVRGSAILDLRPQIRRWALALPLVIGLPYGLAALVFPGEGLGYGALIGRLFAALSSGTSLIPAEFLAAFGLLYVWMRGVHWAAADGLPSEIRGRFKFGFFALLAYIFAFMWRGAAAELGAFLYVFFFFGWLAMACARLGRVEAQNAAGMSFFRSQWLLAILGGLLACSLLLVLMGWGIQAQFAFLQRAMLSLWLLFWGLVVLLLSPAIIGISLLFEWILARVDIENWALLETLRDFFSSADENITEVFQDAAQSTNVPFLQRLSDWLSSLPYAQFLAILRTGFFWGLLLLVLVIGLYQAGKRIGFWRALATRRSDEQAHIQNEDWWRTMASSWRARLDDLRRNLANLLDPQQGRRLLAAARIRRVYTFLMDLSTELGKTRPQAQTPLEFMPTLLKLFPLHNVEVEAISAAYMRVRYGELAETPSDVIEVDRAWLQLKREGERMKKRRKKEAAEAKSKRRDKQKTDAQNPG